MIMNNVLLTRRCNLTCEYCRIIKDYDDMPYESIEKLQEVEPEKWMKFGKWIKENTDGFIILYGGEPFLYPGLEEILKYYNENDIAYTVITNSTKRKEALDLVERGILRGLSASVDPTIFETSEDHTKDKSRLLKSSRGLELMIAAKEINPEVDATAEIVLDRYNYKYLPKLVRLLAEHDIYSDITIIETEKNKYYDFCQSVDDLLLTPEQRQEVSNIIDELLQEENVGKYIHTPEVIKSVLKTGDRTFCNLDKEYTTSTIEPNGDIRLCLRIKGLETPKLNIFDLIDKGYNAKQVSDIVTQYTKKDIEKCCEGCGWTCVHMYTSGLDAIKHK